MKLLTDLIRAAAVTLMSGLGVLFAEGVLGDQFGQRTWLVVLFWAAIAGSIAAGVAVLARRHRDAIVPIAAIYVVAMLAVLLFLGFVLAWYGGRIEL